MKSAYNWYTKAEQLGEGGFGTVFKGLSRITGAVVAMKEIPFIGPYPSTTRAVESEVLALRTLKHSNIVRLHDVYYEETKLYGDPSSCALDSVTTHSFMKQLLKGIRFCHQRNFYHRDLKPNNLLTQYEGGKWVLKIADFGLASSINLGEHRTSKVTTIGYRAPELLLQCTTYSTPIDIWSIGCIFAEMLCGKPLFYRPGLEQLECIIRTHGSPSDAQLQNMKRAHPEIVICPVLSRSHYYKIPWKYRLPTASTDATALLDRFLTFDPAERISAATAIYDAYFQNAQQLQHYHDPRSIHHQASQSYSQRTFNPPAYHGQMIEAKYCQHDDVDVPVYPSFFPPPIFSGGSHRQAQRQLTPQCPRILPYSPQDPEYTHAYKATSHYYGNAGPINGATAGVP